MVTAGGVACVLALVCACGYSDSSGLSSGEGVWGDMKQHTVHATAKHQGVQERPKSKQTQAHRSEASAPLREMPQHRWKALRFLLEKARRKLPAQALAPKAMRTLVHDSQGHEGWLEPQPWHLKQKQAQHSPVKATWVMGVRPVSSASDPVSKSHSPIVMGLRSQEPEMDEASAQRPSAETLVTNLTTTETLVITPLTPTPATEPLLTDTPTAESLEHDVPSFWKPPVALNPHVQKSTSESEQSFQSPGFQVLPTNDPVTVNEPVDPQSVSAHCGESLLHLQVKRDFFGTGQLISPLDVSLGGCAPTGFNSFSETLLFETELHTCGSTVEMTDSLLIYTFALYYMPVSTKDTFTVKSHSTVVNISCQYQRLQSVSSSGLMPTWQDFRNTNVFEAILDFSLKLMNDDWMAERASAKYFLGDVMNVEASVHQLGHVPFQVFVEKCVASSGTEREADPAYYFIEKDGCLLDSKLAQSRSQFMPTTQDGALRFQLETFRFAGVSQNTLYITCTLTAVLNSNVTDHMHKACHFSRDTHRWVSADGRDEICSCCAEETCPHRRARSLDGKS
ncbi:hypothetical protein ACEWY4_001975 [Coilia grayii]|uniref:Zona pellucida sperm-binding protein 3 n=1 Tax=Coilia grayii TaxID=363190 RepID=A0ABD1KUI2_9TELE